jgi:PAS domain S-box-containing protein
MRTTILLILLTILAAAGMGGSYALSEAFRNDARDAWKAEASQAGQWLSEAVLGWLEESYAPLSGLAILFENSENVTEIEFLGATDALEARAMAPFLDTKAVARPRTGVDDWLVVFTNDPFGPLSSKMPLKNYPVILETLKAAVDNPDQIMLGPPYSVENGLSFLPTALAIHDTLGPLVLIGLVNFDAIVKGLFDIHKPKGLQLQIQGRFVTSGGQGPILEVTGEPMPNALYSVTTRTVSAGADLSITWYMNSQFSNGPQEGLANVTLISGIGATLAIILFIGLMLQWSRIITRRVQAELDNQQALLDSVINSIPDLIFVKDKKGVYLACNRSFSEFIGGKREDIIGVTDYQFFDRETAENFLENDRKLMASGQTLQNDKWVTYPDGSRVLLDTLNIPFLNSDGHVIGVVGISRDITERYLAQKTLKQSEERLSLALDVMNLGVWDWSLQSDITAWDDRMYKIYGIPRRDSMPYQDWLGRIVREDLGSAEASVDRVIAEKTQDVVEFRIKRPDGDIRHIYAVERAILDEQGEVARVVGVNLDITERKRDEQELKKLSQAVEQSPVSVVITDPAGIIQYVNPKFCQVTEFNVEEAIGKNPRILKSGKTPPETYRELWKTIKAGDEWRGEFLNKKKNGKLYWETASISPIKSDEGAITHYLAIKEDVTDRKNMENELQKRVNELDDLQSAMLNMMEDLEEEKLKAEAATRAKGDFLANMSHEIRTPMNAIIGMSHLALKTDLSAKQQDYIEKIQSSANSLLGIINDILDFSKIEAGKLDMESVDFNLEEVMKNLGNLITVKAQEKEDLEVLFATGQEVPRFLVGDPLRLGQILINLSNNAVKFTEKGEIVVSTELLDRNDDRVTLKFSVSDTGIGITKEQIDKLFQSFSQADTSTTRKFGGTGLGLTISKRLVEMMDGQIRVESEPGQGTTFSFTAVFGLGTAKVKKRLALSADLKDMKVLVVDDNATSRNILQDILESFSFEVFNAASGEDGIEEIERADKEKPFELVIMDWKMPGMDGIETSRRIKTHTTLRKIPAIIMVTAYGRENLMERSEKLGLDGFLLKPVSPSVLFDTIMQAFDREVSESSHKLQKQDQKSAELKHIREARILLVEDNDINQQVAMEILKGNDLTVDLAVNGKEAVEAVKQTHYDAVLMDVQMPVMDGYTATREIRRDYSAEQLPIIAMTAHAMAGDEEKSLKAGMNGHVTKPIDPDHLFATLVKWIQPIEKRTEGLKPDAANEPPESEQQILREQAFPESLPGFDLPEGLKRLMGNKDLYRKLLLDFASKYKDTAKEIRKAMDAKDLTSIQSLVHKLKGLAGNLSATELQSAATEMEKLVKNEQIIFPPQEALIEKFKVLETTLGKAFKQIQQLSPQIEEASEEATEDALNDIPPELAKETAGRIKAAVEEGDVMAIMTIAEELKGRKGDFAQLGTQILQLAEEFDYDGILKLAEALGS